MIKTRIYGFQAEGRNLCPGCAERYYGNNLEIYLNAGDVQVFIDKDRPAYAGKGLLCDDCLHWIFKPVIIDDPWWRDDPEPEEYLRLLAPFTGFLESLQIDTVNLRNITI